MCEIAVQGKLYQDRLSKEMTGKGLKTLSVAKESDVRILFTGMGASEGMAPVQVTRSGKVVLIVQCSDFDDFGEMGKKLKLVLETKQRTLSSQEVGMDH